ncbi:DUF6233 domain-containing protein [Streptomyces spectabilis]|uniref:DUF6233 domain-containing protein n=1 Tax=Streptomyces spectabilis TaxID=68270 RepID=UPI0033D6E8A5
MWGQRLDEAIAAAEQREAERAHGAAVRPPAPDWLIETGVSADRLPIYVHRGDCRMVGKRSRSATAEQARRARYEQVPECPHCEPDKYLGVLE